MLKLLIDKIPKQEYLFDIITWQINAPHHTEAKMKRWCKTGLLSWFATLHRIASETRRCEWNSLSPFKLTKSDGWQIYIVSLYIISPNLIRILNPHIIIFIVTLVCIWHTSLQYSVYITDSKTSCQKCFQHRPSPAEKLRTEMGNIQSFGSIWFPKQTLFYYILTHWLHPYHLCSQLTALKCVTANLKSIHSTPTITSHITQQWQRFAQFFHPSPQSELVIVRNACEKTRQKFDRKSFYLEISFQRKLRKETALVAKLHR